MRHFVLVLHSHLLEIQRDGQEGLAREELDGPLASPRIHVWAQTPSGALRKLEERLNHLLGDKEYK